MSKKPIRRIGPHPRNDIIISGSIWLVLSILGSIFVVWWLCFPMIFLWILIFTIMTPTQQMHNDVEEWKEQLSLEEKDYD